MGMDMDLMIALTIFAIVAAFVIVLAFVVKHQIDRNAAALRRLAINAMVASNKHRRPH